MVHLDGAQGEQLVLTGLRGRRLPPHCTALGKVLIGGAPEAVREAYASQPCRRLEGSARALPTPIVDRDKFFEHLRTVAGVGYALDLEECEPGLCCAAAPVHDAAGRMIAALSISGPAFRLGEERLLRGVVPAVIGAARRSLASWATPPPERLRRLPRGHRKRSAAERSSLTASKARSEAQPSGVHPVDFGLSDEQLALQAPARRFAREQVAPVAATLTAPADFPAR